MRTIPTCYYDKSITKLIDSLIDDGYSSYSELRDIDKQEITAQCIQALGDDAYSCIIEPDDFCKTMSHFKKFLITCDSDEIQDMAEVMRKNAIDYFSDDMDTLFSERSRIRQYFNMKENGFSQFVDRTNGEVEWRVSA